MLLSKSPDGIDVKSSQFSKQKEKLVTFIWLSKSSDGIDVKALQFLKQKAKLVIFVLLLKRPNGIDVKDVSWNWAENVINPGIVGITEVDCILDFSEIVLPNKILPALLKLPLTLIV